MGLFNRTLLKSHIKIQQKQDIVHLLWLLVQRLSVIPSVVKKTMNTKSLGTLMFFVLIIFVLISVTTKLLWINE